MGLEVADLFASLSLKPNAASWQAGDKLIGAVKTGLAALGAYKIAQGIENIFTSTMDAAIGAERLAQKIGSTTEKVQELEYAASTTGVSTEELQIGFTKLARGLEEFRTKGTGPAGEALVKLKVPLAALKKDSPDEVLGAIADRFEAMPDGIEKTALAVEIFGRSGANLIPLLNKGSGAIGELRNEAEDLGVVIDSKTAKSFEGLEESSLRIKGSIQGFKNTLAIALLPTIQRVADSIFTWIKANREVIAADIKGFVEGLVTVFGALADAVGFVADIFRNAWAGDDGAQAILIGIAAAIATLVIPALWGMAVAVTAATWPLALIVAAVALVSLGVLKIVKHWDQVKSVMRSVADWFVGVGHGIVNAFDTAWEAVKSAAKAAFEWIINLPVVKQLIELYNYFNESNGRTVENPTGGDVNGQHYTGVTDYITGGAMSKIASYGDSPAGSVTPNANGKGDTQVNAPTTINVTSNSSDPKAVADEVGKQWQAQWHGILRDAHASTGGSDQ